MTLMTLLYVALAFAVLFLAVTLALALGRPRRQMTPMRPAAQPWPRVRHRESIDVSWDEPKNRRRLGGLGQ